MSVRIKVSYETEEELKKIRQLLNPVVKNWTRAAWRNKQQERENQQDGRRDDEQ